VSLVERLRGEIAPARARAVFEAHYTSRQNLVQFEAIYREAREVAERDGRMAG
jgi:hypothetical protein